MGREKERGVTNCLAMLECHNARPKHSNPGWTSAPLYALANRRCSRFIFPDGVQVSTDAKNKVGDVHGRGASPHHKSGKHGRSRDVAERKGVGADTVGKCERSRAVGRHDLSHQLVTGCGLVVGRFPEAPTIGLRAVVIAGSFPSQTKSQIFEITSNYVNFNIAKNICEVQQSGRNIRKS